MLLAAQPAAHASEAPAPAEQLHEGLVNPGYHEQPDWFKQSFLDIREDIREATAQGKRLMLYFYQDGCPYCAKLLDTNFALRDITEKTRSNLDVIAINLWGDREVVDFSGATTTEKKFAEALKVMFTPTLLFLDEQGQVVMRLNGYYPPQKFGAVVDYVGQRLEQKVSFRDYWSEQAPQASTGKLHRDASHLQPPYRLAERVSGKPLLVFFEQLDCRECDELHLDILQRPESTGLLARFDVVLLDMQSKTPLQAPDGRQTTASDWASQLNIQYVPSMVMFSTAGKEVFRTEAYLKAFHMQSAMDYVVSGAYLEQPNFQRFLQARADALEAQGIHVDIME